MSEVAKVGDKIKIINAYKLGLKYKVQIGDVVEVVDIAESGSPKFETIEGDIFFASYDDAYEIVERAEENKGTGHLAFTSDSEHYEFLGEVKDVNIKASEGKPITVYISGPMTGKDEYNYPLFYEVEEKLEGHTFTLDDVSYTITEVINPAALDEELGIEGMVWHDFLKRDMEVIFGRDVDAVILFDDWENSRGANLEMYVASQAGKMILNFDLETEELTTADLSVAYEAQSIVLGKRRYDYGHPLDNFLNIATLWDGTLRMAGKLADGASIDIRDVYALMEQVKIAREYNAPKRDNQVDVAGYAYAYETSKQEALRRGMDLSGLMDANLKKLRENGSNGFSKTLKDGN